MNSGKMILCHTAVMFKFLGKKKIPTCYNPCASENFYLKIPCKSQPFLLHSMLLSDLKINFNLNINI